jgi:hypothetical protein
MQEPDMGEEFGWAVVVGLVFWIIVLGVAAWSTLNRLL